MSETNHNSRPGRRRTILRAALVIAIIGMFAAAVWYVRSPQFHAWVRAKVVADIEQVTGGRVELGSFTWDLLRLECEATDVTIHGRESAGQVPYAHVDRLLVRASVWALLGRRFGLRNLELEHPVIHLIVYPDGSTNQPAPKMRTRGAGAMQDLFDLAVRRATVRGGVLYLNERRIPLEVTAENLALTMGYDPRARHYDGSLRVSRLNAAYGDYRPVAVGAEARFRLLHSRAEIRSLKIVSGNSEMQASGELVDYTDPKVRLSYTASLELAQVASTLLIPQVRQGTLTISGEGNWSAADFGFQGKLGVRGANWVERGLRVPSIGADADFSINNRELSLRQVKATVLGGSATGDLKVLNWRASPSAPTAGKRPRTAAAEQNGVANLRLQGLTLSHLAQAGFGGTLARVNLAGTVSGTVTANWKGSPADVVAKLALDANAPSAVAREQVPVSGMLRGVYNGRAGTLNIETLSLATRRTQANASGVLGSRTEALHVAVKTSDLQELQPLVAAFGGPREWPVRLLGHAAFTGSLNGKLSAPTIAGRLELFDFETSLPSTPLVAHVNLSSIVPASTAALPRAMHWDRLNANVSYGPSLASARGVAQSGKTHINFDFNARLQKGAFTKATPFTFGGNGHAEVSHVLAAAGIACPGSGVVAFDLHLAGSAADPRGNGSLSVAGATVCGETLQRATTAVSFANREAQFRNLDIVYNAAEVTGDAAYHLDSGAFRFDLRGRNIQLARIARLQRPRLSLSGLVDFSATGSGTRDAPSIQANLQARSLLVNGERVGDVIAKAVTTGETLQLTAHSRLQDASLDIEGTTRLRGDYQSTYDVRFSGLDIDPLLLMFLRGRLTAHSRAAGNVVVQGPLATPAALNVSAEVQQLQMEVAHVALHNDGPIRFVLANNVLGIEHLRLVGTDTALAANGSVQLSGPQLLDVAANGQLNLRLLQGLSPDVVSYGLVTLNMRVSGSLGRPLVDGQIEVKDAGVSYIDFPNGLSDLNGRLVFNRDRLQIASLTGKTGGGTLEFSGFLTYARTLGFNLTAQGRDVRIRYPPGVSVQSNLNLRLTGTLERSLLSGDVVITRFGVNPDFDFGTYLAQAKQPAAAPNPQLPLARLTLDVHIASTPELQVQTSLAKISGDADLRLRGTAQRPVLLGRVNIVEGELSFYGARYHLEHGDIAFTNPVRIEPVLELEATTTVRDYEISLGFHGPIDKLTTTYRSDPPLATADIVNLLAFGRTREESAQQTAQLQNLPETATYALLNRALSQAVSSRMQKLFGVSRIKVDPEAGGVANNPAGAAVTIEQQVANNLTLTYITNLSRANYQTIQAEYNVNRNVSLVAVRDWNGVVSFDIRIRQRKR